MGGRPNGAAAVGDEVVSEAEDIEVERPETGPVEVPDPTPFNINDYPTALQKEHLALHLFFNENIKTQLSDLSRAIENYSFYDSEYAESISPSPAQNQATVDNHFNIVERTNQEVMANIAHELETVQTEYHSAHAALRDHHMIEEVNAWDARRREAYTALARFLSVHQWYFDNGFLPELTPAANVQMSQNDSTDLRINVMNARYTYDELWHDISQVEDDIPDPLFQVQKLATGFDVETRSEFWRGVAIDVLIFVATDIALAILTGGGSLILSGARLIALAARSGAQVIAMRGVTAAAVGAALGRSAVAFVRTLTQTVREIIETLLRGLDELIEAIARGADGIAAYADDIFRGLVRCRNGSCRLG